MSRPPYSDSDSDCDPPPSSSRRSPITTPSRTQQIQQQSPVPPASHSQHSQHMHYQSHPRSNNNNNNNNNNMYHNNNNNNNNHNNNTPSPISHRSSQSIKTHSSHSSHSSLRQQPKPSHHPQQQKQPMPDYSDSDDEDDNKHNKNNNDGARSTVYHSNRSQTISSRSSNTWSVIQNNYRKQQQEQQQLQIMQIHSYNNNKNNNDYNNYDDEQKSVIPLSTVAPPRQQFRIPSRPDFLEDFPLSHAKPIKLTVNAIRACPRIHGILHVYNVRFHANSNDPNDADIPENNRSRRMEIIQYELSRQIREIYGKFDFDNTLIYCDKKILITQQFQYAIRDNDDEQKHNGKYGIVRIQYNKELDFDNIDAIRSLSHEYLSQIAHILHRNIMRKIGYVQFGRSHYIDPDKTINLRIREYPYLEAMHGFMSTMEYTKDFQTVIFFRNKLRLKEKRRINEIMDNYYNESLQYQYESNQEQSRIYAKRCRQDLVGRYFITLYARKSIRKIHGINFNKTLNDTFHRKGNMISFREYYKMVYNEDLRQEFPGLIEVKNRHSGRIDYYPPELCYLTGYPPNLRSNKKITGIIARNSSIPLPERIGNFEKVIKKLNQYNQLEDRQLMIANNQIRGHSRTLEYGSNLLQIDAKRIEPTTILYNSISENGIAMITDDQLLRNLKDIRPFGTCGGGNNDNLHIIKWGICYFMHQPQNQYERGQNDRYCFETLWTVFHGLREKWFPNELQNDMKLMLDPYPECIEIKSPFLSKNNMDLYKRNIIHYLDDAIKQYQLEGLIIILPSICGSNDDDLSEIYNTIKALCNIKTGTITQCIRASTICPENRGRDRGRDRGRSRNKTEQSLLSTFRQFMIKLGIIPWKIILRNINEMNDNNVDNQRNPKLNYLVDNVINLSIPTMIIGIDVNHNRKHSISTVGFISTYDEAFCRVMAQVDAQKLGQEVVGIEKLQQLTENAIRNFHAINGVYPHQIFVYRDGVSIGELDVVSEKELNAIRRATANIINNDNNNNNNERVKIQFMIVQKRVNARFFESRYNGYGDQELFGANPRVIVDSGIISNKFWDFYLIACGAPKDKVANPVRVIIINDDLNLGMKGSKNDIELFTYALCNLYYGWGGAVKIPHVIKYADKIAEQYANTYQYIDIINCNQNKPNTITGINLAHHYL